MDGFIGAAAVPLVPNALLGKHQVYEPNDTRFRAAARLLQTLWRDEQGLAAGYRPTRRGGTRKLGSRLTSADATAGRNFLDPQIARLARHESIYREIGALIKERRLFENLLSSQALTFNLFGPMRLAPTLATRLLRRLLPSTLITAVTNVAFETSPMRRSPAFTNDQTAFDVAISYARPNGGRGFLALEVKYSEDLAGSSAERPFIYDDLAEASGLFKHPLDARLRVGASHQLFREHLLAQSMLMAGSWDEVHFALIAPRRNQQVIRGAQLYTGQLAPLLPGMVPFSVIDLETVIDAYDHAGDTAYASALHDRYTDFTKVDALIAASLAEKTPTWSIALPAGSSQLALAHG